MEIIDTHAHLFADDFADDLDQVVSDAISARVKKILLPNIDENSIVALKDTVKKYPNLFLPMMGLHPTSVTEYWDKQLDIIEEELNSNPYIAVGEIGLDLYWDKSTLEIQQRAFEEQLDWSIQKNLPVSIHSRESINEVIRSIKRVGENKIYGSFHSFGGNEKELESVLSLKNFYLGINGVVTFKNSGLDKVIKECPLERIILETDSPWLTPTPNRGKRNESKYLSEIVQKLSEIYQVTETVIANKTTYNACNLFKI